MRCLIDTHAFIWILTADPRLSVGARRCFHTRANEFFLSAASVWEMAIKTSLGRLALGVDLDHLVRKEAPARGIAHLPVEPEHALAVAALPFHHRDPFDRLLVAQARLEGLRLLSADAALDKYGVPRIW
ncbi:MAG: type II toxin-antitoxin system VapC family toxin [Myxococcota bacterium]